MFHSNAPKCLLDLTNNNVFGFGNSPYDKSLAKVNYGTKLFEDIIFKNKNEDKEIILNKLIELLKDDTKCWPDEELKFRAPEWGEYLSSIKVNVPEHNYGTRTHTIILFDHFNNVDYYEETMTPNGEWKNTHLTL
jgi:uncharacterized protein with NRDE domain